MREFESMNLNADEALEMNGHLFDAALDERTGTVVCYDGTRGIAWVALVVKGDLQGQIAAFVGSEEEAHMLAQSLSQVAGATMAATHEAQKILQNLRH